MSQLDHRNEESERIHAILASAIRSCPPAERDSLARAIAPLLFNRHGDRIRITTPYPLFGVYYNACLREKTEQLLRSVFGQQIDIAYADGMKAASPEPLPDASGRVPEDPFKNFITGPKNRFAVEAAKAIAAPDSPFKLLALHGPGGSGKSRLLAAIETLVIASRGLAACHRCRAGHFTFPPDPEAFWAAPRALLLDDVHELATSGQNALAIHIDLALASPRWSRIALATSQPLSSLSANLARRMASGLTVELCAADLSMRVRYAERKCQELGLPPRHALDFARHSKDIPSLQGLLHKLAFYGRLTNQPLSAEQIEKLALPENEEPDWRILIGKVAGKLQIRPAEIFGQSRKKNIAQARQVAMYLCRQRLGLAYAEIGRLFGGRDHSTVIHAINKVQQLRSTDKILHNLLTELEESC